jgi:hypothetical protein
VNNKVNELHHQQTPARNNKFIKNVTQLVHTMEDFHSPFLAEYSELHNLYTKNVPDVSVVSTVKNNAAIYSIHTESSREPKKERN